MEYKSVGDNLKNKIIGLFNFHQGATLSKVEQMFNSNNFSISNKNYFYLPKNATDYNATHSQYVDTRLNTHPGIVSFSRSSTFCIVSDHHKTGFCVRSSYRSSSRCNVLILYKTSMFET